MAEHLASICSRCGEDVTDLLESGRGSAHVCQSRPAAERKLPVLATAGYPPMNCEAYRGMTEWHLLVKPEVLSGVARFSPRSVEQLRAMADWLERANGIAPKRPLQWRPLSELTGESRYILVADTEHVASRVRYSSRASISIEQICLQQEGYEPTHFCELPEFEG